MHAAGERVAGIQIPSLCRSDRAARNFSFARCSLKARERLADVEPESGVERERTIVKSGLHETHTGWTALVRAIHGRLHQLAPDAKILGRGIDGDWTNASDERALVHAIAAHDAAFALCNDTVETGCGKEHREQADRGLRSGQVTRKTVLAADRGESVVANFAASGGVGRSGETDGNLCFGCGWHWSLQESAGV